MLNKTQTFNTQSPLLLDILHQRNPSWVELDPLKTAPAATKNKTKKNQPFFPPNKIQPVVQHKLEQIKKKVKEEYLQLHQSYLYEKYLE